jgi:hypothetical protein
MKRERVFIDVAISEDRNMIKKEVEKILKQRICNSKQRVCRN